MFTCKNLLSLTLETKLPVQSYLYKGRPGRSKEGDVPPAAGLVCPSKEGQVPSGGGLSMLVHLQHLVEVAGDGSLELRAGLVELSESRQECDARVVVVGFISLTRLPLKLFLCEPDNDNDIDFKI